MDRKTKLFFLLGIVILIIFNTIFFTAGGERSASSWVSYIFIHISFLLVAATPFLMKKCSKDTVFGISIYKISVAYFFAEIVIGLLFMLLQQDSINASLVTQVVLAGVYAIILISHMILTEKNTSDNKEEE